MIRSLLFVVLLGTVFSQNYGNEYDTVQHIVELTFQNKVVECGIINVIGLQLFRAEDCLMFLYINDKRVSTTAGIRTQYKYNQLLLSKVRCEAQCENDSYKDRNITPKEIEINKTIFIGLCVGAGVVLILLIIAIFCGVRHCRGHYYKKLPEQGKSMELEKQPPVAPTAPEEKPPSYQKSFDAELASEVRSKKISESSESGSDEENLDGNLYNYNPNSKYNYAEMTSEI